MELLKVSEVALVLGVSSSAIRNYERRGLLRCERTVGGHRLFDKREIFRFRKEFLECEIRGADLGRKIARLRAKNAIHTV